MSTDPTPAAASPAPTETGGGAEREVSIRRAARDMARAAGNGAPWPRIEARIDEIVSLAAPAPAPVDVLAELRDAVEVVRDGAEKRPGVVTAHGVLTLVLRDIDRLAARRSEETPDHHYSPNGEGGIRCVDCGHVPLTNGPRPPCPVRRSEEPEGDASASDLGTGEAPMICAECATSSDRQLRCDNCQTLACDHRGEHSIEDDEWLCLHCALAEARRAASVPEEGDEHEHTAWLDRLRALSEQWLRTAADLRAPSSMSLLLTPDHSATDGAAADQAQECAAELDAILNDAPTLAASPPVPDSERADAEIDETALVGVVADMIASCYERSAFQVSRNQVLFSLARSIVQHQLAAAPAGSAEGDIACEHSGEAEALFLVAEHLPVDEDRLSDALLRAGFTLTPAQPEPEAPSAPVGEPKAEDDGEHVSLARYAEKMRQRDLTHPLPPGASSPTGEPRDGEYMPVDPDAEPEMVPCSTCNAGLFKDFGCMKPGCSCEGPGPGHPCPECGGKHVVPAPEPEGKPARDLMADLQASLDKARANRKTKRTPTTDTEEPNHG